MTSTPTHIQRINSTMTKTARIQATCKVCRNIWYTFGARPDRPVRCPICTDGGRPVVLNGGGK